MSTDNEQVVNDFCAAWSTKDVEKICSFFTEDAVYHNIPVEPISGRDAIKAAIGGFAGTWTSVVFEVKASAASGDYVLNERVDHIEAGGKMASLPVAGVFRLRDGKIAEWRDYFDMAMFTKAMS